MIRTAPTATTALVTARPRAYQYRARLYCPRCVADVAPGRAPGGTAVLPIPAARREAIVAVRPCAACGARLPIPPLFALGRLAATAGALALCEARLVNPVRLLTRHWTGDWGAISPEDRGLNEDALRDGARLLSVYPLEGGATVWVITEADRHATTLLTPDEY